jgi:hypothetical protein
LNTFASGRGNVVPAFLKGVLANSPVSVAELERLARMATLLGKRQPITHSKPFKRAKLALGIRSVRDGFGAAGKWFWALPQDTGLDVAQSSGHLLANVLKSKQLPRLEPESQYCIGVPRQWVDGIASLDRHRPPRDVPSHVWILFIRDCRQFVDLWAAQAAALGWDATSLFGCSPTQPLANLGRAGLVWVLGGRKLIRLYPDWASIESIEGSLHVFNRRATIYEGKITLPWCLR